MWEKRTQRRMLIHVGSLKVPENAKIADYRKVHEFQYPFARRLLISGRYAPEEALTKKCRP